MAETLSEKVAEAGHKVAEAASKVGHAISEGVGQAADWAKEKLHAGGGPAEKVRPKMEVVGSCGNKLGVVDAVEGDVIKLTKNDSPDGMHHYLPLDYVDKVDGKVHLSVNCGQAKQRWNVVPQGSGK